MHNLGLWRLFWLRNSRYCNSAYGCLEARGLRTADSKHILSLVILVEDKAAYSSPKASLRRRPDVGRVDVPANEVEHRQHDDEQRNNECDVQHAGSK